MMELEKQTNINVLEMAEGDFSSLSKAQRKILRREGLIKRGPAGYSMGYTHLLTDKGKRLLE